jgi:hypothetical protein
MGSVIKIGDQTISSTVTLPNHVNKSHGTHGKDVVFSRQLLSEDNESKKTKDSYETSKYYQEETEAARQQTIEEFKTIIRAIQSGNRDPRELTDLIFYARHPELIDLPLTKDHQYLLDEWNTISALLVHPTLNEIDSVTLSSGAYVNQSYNKSSNRFDDVIELAVENCPGLSPSILKSLLAQESNFNPTVINKYGYAGIAQFGRAEAREVGLQVGVAGSSSDERLNPYKAIPAAAKLLAIKAERLKEMAFSRYGHPEGTDFWKFVLGAYNGGEGTISLAMGHAYREGLLKAKTNGLIGVEATTFARKYASKWENLTIGGMSSPLGMAVERYFPSLAEAKFHEIGEYPKAIVARANS